MGSTRPDLSSKIFPDDPEPDPIDYFDRLPDSIVLLVFNSIGDVKALGCCSVVSRRFQSLIPQVENVVVRVDCVISDDAAGSTSSSGNAAGKSRHPFSSFLRFMVSSFLRPLQSLSQFVNPNAVTSRRTISPFALGDGGLDQGSVTHHSPTQVLKNFNEIRDLRIELPSGELGLDDGVLLKWRADFGSTLDSCVILGASSVVYGSKASGIDSNMGVIEDLSRNGNGNNEDGIAESDNGSMPESFYTNGGLKLRVVWTISSLIAASARHYLLQPIIAEHKTLGSLVLTDSDGQGVLCMNKEQLEELRLKPLSASSASKRTLVPALNMKLWFASQLELPDGTVLKGATLVAIRPSEQPKKDVMGPEGKWVTGAFVEPYQTAAGMLLKRRTYCLEMNSF